MLELPGRGRPARRIAMEGGAEEVAEGGVAAGAGLLEVGDAPELDAGSRLLDVAAGEELAAQQALVEDQAEAPEVELGVRRVAAQGLGREIGERPREMAGTGQGGGIVVPDRGRRGRGDLRVRLRREVAVVPAQVAHEAGDAEVH